MPVMFITQKNFVLYLFVHILPLPQTLQIWYYISISCQKNAIISKIFNT